MILSYSQINLFESCPFSWYKKYVEKVPGEPINRVFLEGSVVHKLNDYFLHSDRDIPGAIRQSAKIFNDEIRKLNIVFEIGDSPSDCLAAIIESFIRLLRMERNSGVFSDPDFKVEWSFKVPLSVPGWLVMGFVDLIYKDADLIRIVDFKNSKDSKFLSRKQLEIYDWAFTKRTAVKANISSFFIIKSETIEEHAIDISYHSEIEAYLNSYALKMQNGIDALKAAVSPPAAVFPQQPEFMRCKRCAYRNLCSASLFRDSKITESEVEL